MTEQPTAPAYKQVAATCRCGRIGLCSICCCARPDHARRPDEACSLCGHVSRVGRVEPVLRDGCVGEHLPSRPGCVMQQANAS